MMQLSPQEIADYARQQIPMPLGIIRSHRGDSVRFEFTRPTDGAEIQPGVKFTVWNWIQNPDGGSAYAAVYGEITEVSSHEAAGLIQGQGQEPNWPAAVDICGAGMPLYLADYDPAAEPGFHADPMGQGLRLDGYAISYDRPGPSLPELRFLLTCAEEHQRNTGIPIHAENLVRSVLALVDAAAENPAPPEIPAAFDREDWDNF